jgi:glycogen debranching enzyme
MNMRFTLLVLLSLSLKTFALTAGNALAIKVLPGESRNFVATNKMSGFWFGPVNHDIQDPHMGWTVSEQKIISGYLFKSGDKPYFMSNADSVIVDFSGMTVHYPAFSYQLSILDSVNTLYFKILKNALPVTLHLQVPFAKKVTLADNRKETRKTIPLKLKKYDKIYVDSNFPFSTENGHKGIKIGMKTSYVSLSVKSENGMVATPKTYNFRTKLQNKVASRERLLSRSHFASSNPHLTKAVAWAKISLSDLVTNQAGNGIYAGLPWFNNYWGRDTFISFGGAIFVSADFDAGLKIVDSFARWQNSDESSRDFGRIPNRVTLSDKIYNTADGTPWFLFQLRKMLDYGISYESLKSYYPVIKNAVDGVLTNYIDDNGFITHDDADTWMDAKGSNGPWSPRGNRAIEIQALWLQAFAFAIDMAKRENDLAKARQWQVSLDRLSANLFANYFGEAQIIDHLNADGSPDARLRPNQFLALYLLKANGVSLQPYRPQIRDAFSRLVFPWGVASLYQFDENYHPWHHYAPYYVQDAAYHNGIVWTWLSGAMISTIVTLGQNETTYALLNETASQILHRGAVGTQSELLDAMPRLGQKYPQLSGTQTQAWNLAEFVRNVHEDLAGIQPHLGDGSITITPLLVEELDWIEVKQALANDAMVHFEWNRTGEVVDFSFKYDHSDGVNLKFALPNQATLKFDKYIEPNRIYTWSASLSDTEIVLKNDDRSITAEKIIEEPWPFAQPVLNVTTKSLSGPGWPLLTTDDVRYVKTGLAQPLLSATDAAGDDKGPNNRYEYPKNANFKDGMFDLRAFDVHENATHYLFRIKLDKLHDSGYRPKLGFDYTYVTIVLNVESHKNAILKPGRNSGFSAANQKADYYIYVGNGILVVDAKTKAVIAEYRPYNMGYQLGDTANGEIKFALPKKYIKSIQPGSAHILLAGGLDDHGGDGVGDFRAVRVGAAAEWIGGGKPAASAPNYYDRMTIK